MKRKIEEPKPFNLFEVLNDPPPDAASIDEARRSLEEFGDARRDRYLSVKRMVAMGHRLKGAATFRHDADWIPYLTMIRIWCEASEQDA